MNGKVVAFTLGEEVSDDTFVVHIEKAFAEIQGAYPMINQQFVEHECMKYKYINREEDTGAEGLRKAKAVVPPGISCGKRNCDKEGGNSMIAEKMKGMVANSSAIRAMFEEGNRLAKLYGRENVFDFSLGNPNVEAPEAVKEALISIVKEEAPLELHGYTNSNAGYEEVRQAVAESLNERFQTEFLQKIFS